MSKQEDMLALALSSDPLPGWDLVREHRFHPTRRWRWDFAFPSQRLAIEVDGRGRHQTVVGVRNDCEKNNEAVRLGWRVLRFPATDIKHVADWVALIKSVLCGAEPVSRGTDDDDERIETTGEAATEGAAHGAAEAAYSARAHAAREEGQEG